MFNELMGWAKDDKEVERVCGALPMPYFTGPTPSKTETLLYKYYRKIRGGDDLAYQGIGDCVSWGWMHLVDYIQAVEIARDIESDATPEADYGFQDTATEVIYALSRVEIGGGSIRGDGSVGAWAAKAVSEIGTLSRPKLEVLLGPGRGAYDPNRARSWGRSGLPDNLEKVARDFPLQTVSLVTDVGTACWHIEQGNGIAVCSNIGFANGRRGETARDKDGFAYPRGRWDHCMFAAAVRYGSRPGVCIINQWPPEAFSGELALDQPKNSFWVELDVFDRMLRQGDSWTGSKFKGYPVRPLTYKF